MWRILLPTLLVLASSQTALAQVGRVQRGLAFVQVHCAMCHAIGRFGESTIPEAPPFRTLSRKYPIEDLAEALAEGIITGHPSMPQFELDAAQINDVLAYLSSIQE